MNSSEVRVFLEFVRAARPSGELRVPGLRVDFDRWRVAGTGGSEGPTVTVSLSDIARGFARLMHDRVELRKWAFVILASDRFAFDAEFENSAGQKLLNGLWEVSFGEPVSEAAITLIEELAKVEYGAPEVQP